jgi:hypothetical protein
VHFVHNNKEVSKARFATLRGARFQFELLRREAPIQ